MFRDKAGGDERFRRSVRVEHNGFGRQRNHRQLRFVDARMLLHSGGKRGVFGGQAVHFEPFRQQR